MAQEKTAVFTYGRNNPPTIGHEKLFDKTMAVAKEHGTTAHLFTSHSQDSRKNPLSGEHKVKLIKHAYPEAHVASSSKEMPSMLHIAKHLHDQGHKHLVMVAGSDRVKEYEDKLKHYNGTHDKALYHFKTIKVVSAGHRDPDAEGAEGMSGTKLRSHAISGNKESFKAGLMSKLSDKHKEDVYRHVRGALQKTEIYDPHLKISKYQWGEKEGVDKMKKMTPGEGIKENSDMQLEFDGIQTRHFDMCPTAYKLFKQHIEDIRRGKQLGEELPETPPVGKNLSPPSLIKRMRFKQYTDQ